MKTCDYCAKEIDYNHQYCCDECEAQALAFYTKQKRSERPVSIINMIAFIGVIVGGFCCALYDAVQGSLLCAAMLLLLGIAYLIYPFAPDNIVKKFKIQKSVKLIRMLALCFVGLAVILTLLAVFVF